MHTEKVELKRMVKVVKTNLFYAATKGEVATLKELLQDDPYLLNIISFPYSRNLLHVATMHGQTAIVGEVLKINPELARDVDSRKSSPLHIAAAQGNVEIGKKLVEIAAEICWWRDCHGMNPIHIAAINGHVEVLNELLRLDVLPAMERVHRGQTVLHMCIKHRKLRTLKVVAEKLGELVYAQDDDGETLLHLAIRCNQIQILRYLVGSNKIERQTPNSMGKTPEEIMEEIPMEAATYSEIKTILKSLPNQSMLPKITDMTMVVVILIATMAFQAALSPPGGVWQDNSALSHRAGEAVIATTRPKLYKLFVQANTTAFVSSLVTIFLITTGLPSRNVVSLALAMYAMWLSLASVVVSYVASVMVIAPNTDLQSFVPVVGVVGMFLMLVVYVVVCFPMPKYRRRRRVKFWRQEDFVGRSWARNGDIP